jgi:hypothetical protein
MTLFEARMFEGIQWFVLNIFLFFFRSEHVAYTVKDGIPAWGNGTFSYGATLGLVLLGLVGCSGWHRYYLGDCTCCCCFYLTGGFCTIGRLFNSLNAILFVLEIIDFCNLYDMVHVLNMEISQKLKEKNQPLQPTYGVGMVPPGGYGGPPAGYGGPPGGPPAGYAVPPPGSNSQANVSEQESAK